MIRRGAALTSLVVCALVAWLGSQPTAHSEEPTPRTSSARHASITDGLDCRTCHSTKGWKTMTQGDGSGGFDHARTGFPLTGRHTRAACVDCHRADAKARPQCNTCHQDEHNGSLGHECADCHSPVSWQMARAIELHRSTRLPLTGMHALMDCAACHRAAAGRRFVSPPPDCYACHDDDFRNPDVHPSHVGDPTDPDSRPFPRDCSLCHSAHAWSPAVVDPATLRNPSSALSAALQQTPANHDLRFTISSGPHRALRCSDCHSAPDRAPQALHCTNCHNHNPANLAQQHHGRVVMTTPLACLHCHPGGQAR